VTVPPAYLSSLAKASENAESKALVCRWRALAMVPGDKGLARSAFHHFARKQLCAPGETALSWIISSSASRFVSRTKSPSSPTSALLTGKYD
jgi:hypothetical protein